MAATIMACGLTRAARPTASTLMPKNTVTMATPTRAPHDRGVLRQHYRAPEGWTATLLTRKDVPRAVQEPVAAPLPRYRYPVRFTKGITGLSLAVEGLLVKHITKSLTLSLPFRTQFMTYPPRRIPSKPAFPVRPAFPACTAPLRLAHEIPA